MPVPSIRTAGFLCPFEANTYGIDFLSFQIEDAGGTGAKLFEISKDPNAPPPQLRVLWHPRVVDSTLAQSFFNLNFLAALAKIVRLFPFQISTKL